MEPKLSAEIRFLKKIGFLEPSKMPPQNPLQSEYFFSPDEAFAYLELGVSFGTTLAHLLAQRLVT